MQRLQDVHAVDSRHLEVRDDHVERVRPHFLEGLLAAQRALDLVPSSSRIRAQLSQTMASSSTTNIRGLNTFVSSFNDPVLSLSSWPDTFRRPIKKEIFPPTPPESTQRDSPFC